MADGPDEFLERSDVQRVQRVVRERWHQLVLLLIATFMLVLRLRSIGNFLTSSGAVFSGNDAWYHYRQVSYTVQNWPFTMPFDPWSGFPTGTFQGQFGTLYDQIIATVALIVGLGSPSDATIRIVLLVAPAVFGALVAFPTYYLGRKFTDSRGGGLLAAGILAILPGFFFRRTLVGAADHNAAEPFFLLAMLVALAYMLSVVAEEDPVFEMLTDIDELRGSLRQSILAVGLFVLATVAYVLVWPPAVALVGLVGIGVLLYALLTADLSESLALERTMIGIGTGFLGAALGILLFIDSFGFTPTVISAPHVFVPFSIGAFALVFAGYERLRDQYKFPVWVAPLGVAALGVLGIVIGSALLPSVFSRLSSLFVNIFGLNIGQPTATIGEAQSVLTVGTGVIYQQYGLLLGPFILGVLAALYNGIRDRKPERFIIGIVAVGVTLMAFSQIRFNYYLAPFVALFAARVFVWVGGLLSIPDDLPKLDAYQIITVLLIGTLLLPALFFPLSGTVFAQGNGPGAYTNWQGTLDWMDDNTPEEGQLENPSSEPLPYYGTFERTDDYAYEDGTYGVMSWWDYGHWITTTGERIPVANPFQQHATPASQYLLADSEEEAQRVMDEELAAEQQTRYVVLDWKTVVGSTPNGKFGAIPTFHPNQSRSDYAEPIFVNQQGQLIPATYLRTQEYYETLSVRLYYYHGSRIPESLVGVQWDNQRVQTPNGPATVKVLQRPSPVQFFNTVEEANALENGTTSRDGGIGVFAPESVPALEHYRLVHASDESARSNGAYRVGLSRYSQGTGLSPSTFNPFDSWVKVFERVPGATIEGEGPVNTTVTASVTMETSSGATFEYQQQAQTGPDGEFTMTVPYSSTGYENWGPDDGYTNTSVRATGQYEFTATTQTGNETTTWGTDTHVTEAKVIGEDEDAVTVTLNANDSSDSSSDEQDSSS